MRRGKWICQNLLLSAAYILAANVGLHFATVGATVTLVWPAAGVALAALQLFGASLWPGVLLGAFVANATTPVHLSTAGLISLGNTLEALVAVHLLRRARFDVTLERLRDVLVFVGAAVVASTLVGATFGALSLRVTGAAAWAAFPVAWRTWWMGDLMGDLIVAPFALVWVRPRPNWRPATIFEGAALAIGLGGVALLSFWGADRAISSFPGSYAVFPFVIWAALRFGARGSTACTLIISGISVAATAADRGRFARPLLGEGLFLIQAFMGTVALSSLVLGVVVEERDHAIRARDQVISIASHEILSPLSPIRLFVHQLRGVLENGELGEASRKQASGLLAACDQQVDRVVRLVSDLFDANRAMYVGFRLQRVQCDLAELARETAIAFAPELERAGCRLDLEADAPVVGCWDRQRLLQVLSNLLANAIKFGAGSPIRVAVTLRGGDATLTVQDHGSGVRANDAGRIFLPFERGGSTPHVAGLGMGLFVVRSVLEAHGGSIAVYSEPGVETTFAARLPTEIPASARASAVHG